MPARGESLSGRDRSGRRTWIVLAALVGLLLGIGLFTFHYAEGFSYLSSDPDACVNCHIMREQFAGWQAGPHHAVATCNDCHVPHALLSKYLAKALKYAETKDLSPQEKQALHMWEHCVTTIERDPMELDREVDWVIKHKLIEGYRAKHDLPLTHPRVALLDLQYHDISRERSPFHKLQNRGLVEQLHPGVAEGQVVASPEGLDEPILDDPVDLAVELERVVLDGRHAVLPHVERLLLERREPLRLGVAQRPVEVLALDVERTDLTTIGEADAATAGDVVADVADRPDRVLERHVAQHHARVLEHAQHARGRPDLHERRVLAHVRVADDHV